MIRLRAEAKGLTFVVDPPAALPTYCLGDGHHLRQVLINLLGNAVKYTDHGRVSLCITPENQRIFFEVTDTGSGIAPEDQELIFQPFYQTEVGIAKGEGTGLGLTISREFVRLMGGEVKLDSTPGQGSTFHFSIPLPPTDTVPYRAGGPRILRLAEGQAAPRILVAEDHPDNQQVIEQILKQMGCEARIVANGQLAVEGFQAWQPQLILMDMRMPVMDGYAATRAIRALPGGGNLPIVALTASAFEEERGQVLAAGCDELVNKPVDEGRLFQVIGQMLGLRFDYAEVATTDVAQSAADLASLPYDLRRGLANAALLLDKEATLAIVERLRPSHPAEAESIDKLVEEYRFDRILDLCERK